MLLQQLDPNTKTGDRVAYISISDVKSFKECRRRWSYRSHLKWNRTPTVTPKYFARGRAMHSGFAAHYLDNESPGIAFQREFEHNLLEDIIARRKVYGSSDGNGAGGFSVTIKDRPEEVFYPFETDVHKVLASPEYQDDVRIGTEVLKAFVHWANANDDYDEIIDVEKRHVVPLIDADLMAVLPHIPYDRADYAFKADLVVRRGNEHWIIDFKTTKHLWTTGYYNHLLVDEQISAYTKAAEMIYGFPFAGAIFVFVRFDEPNAPKVLGSGGLSKSRNQKTTALRYYEEVKARNLPMHEYADFIRWLHENKVWFQRIEAIRSAEEKDAFWVQLKLIAMEMIDPYTMLYPSPQRMLCETCAWINPCTVESGGSSEALQNVLMTDYAPNPPRD